MSEDKPSPRAAELTLRMAAIEERLRKAEEQLAAMRDGLVVTESLVVQNRAGTVSISFLVLDKTAEMYVETDAGKCVFEAGWFLGTTEVSIRDSQGNLALRCGVGSTGRPFAALYTGDETPRVLASVSSAGPSIEVRDKHGQARFQAALTNQGPSIGLFSDEGQVSWCMPPNAFP